MLRRWTAACALIALAVLAAGGGLPADQRGSPEEVAAPVAAASGLQSVKGSRRPSRRASSDGIDSSDEHQAGKLGPFRWLWRATAAFVLSPPAARPTIVDGTAPSLRFALPEAATRSSRGPPARS